MNFSQPAKQIHYQNVFISNISSSRNCSLRPRENTESYLSTVFRDELIFLDRLFDEDAPTCHVWRGQQQVLRDRGTKTSDDAIWTKDLLMYNTFYTHWPKH